MKHVFRTSLVTAMLVCTLLPVSFLNAEPVSEQQAKTAALRWMLMHGGAEAPMLDVHSVYARGEADITVYYIINFSPEGVVIISGDDIAAPVLMYTAHGRYDGETLPGGLAVLLDNAASEIVYAVSSGYEAPVETAMQWSALLDNDATSPSFLGGGASTMNVSPLLSTRWNQNFPYNKDCPATSTGGSGGHVYAGCVATSMAQVMRYYNSPVTGNGSHSYVHSVYGLQSANFGATTYQWSSMPNSINSQSSNSAKNAIAQLTYHCAVSVNMNFSPSGSGSTTQAARSALVNYFRFSSGATHRTRSYYSESVWISLLTTELNNGRPVIYRGANSNGQNGHAWVVDGYQGTNHFHMNFGWGGYLDGYFYLTSITPGSNNFTYSQGGIFNLQPLGLMAPTLASPSHQATGVCVTPTLSWNASTGASSYQLQVSTSSTFASTVADISSITATSEVVGPLSMGTTYHWRVRATGSAGTSAWSSSRSFTTRNVTINASSPLFICDGASVTLSTASVSGATYSWWRDGVPVIGGTQASLIVTTSGSYTVGVTQNGCTTTSNPTVVTVNQPPAAVILSGPTITACEGSPEMLSAQTVQGATYQWKRDGAAIPGATTASWMANESGVYTVVVTANSCSAESTPTLLTVHPLNSPTLAWTGAVDQNWNTLGNWDNPCTVPTSETNVVIPPGTQPPASIPQTTLRNLTLNNALGVSLSGPVYVTEALYLQAGTLELDEYDLLIATAASVNGAGASSHITTSGEGSLVFERIGTGGKSGTITYPIGVDGSYTPVALSNTATISDIGIRVSKGVLSQGLTGQPLTSAVVNRTWIVKSSNQSNVSFTLQWNAGDELTGFDRTHCTIARNDAGVLWDPLLAMGAAVGNGPFTRSVSGLTTISPLGLPFAVGSGQGLVPVRFLSFSAVRHNSEVLLSWITTDESNNHGFVIERAHAGTKVWREAGFVPAAPSSGRQHNYTWIDNHAPATALQYRLRQIDTDGRFDYSPVLNVLSADVHAAATLSLPAPHPVSAGAIATVRISLPEAALCRLTLIDMLGRTVSALPAWEHPGGEWIATLETARLLPGMYVLLLGYGERQISRTVIVTQ